VEVIEYRSKKDTNNTLENSGCLDRT